MKKDPKKAKARERASERLRTPPKTLDFESLEPAIVDGQLVIKDQTLVLKRARDYEMFTLCRVMRTYPDGAVSLWDETLGQYFMFNLVRDSQMSNHLRVYDKSRLRKKFVSGKESQDDVSVDAESHIGSLLDNERDDTDEFSSGVEETSTGVTEPQRDVDLD